ncbi:hypothetical protein [Pseudopedobacter beijingensis]|uniref:DUF4238 domain-containing protein n=1 Tax=Pseudopedobacter beijingensis TaxID=1207056 RepID=A0ABW4I8C8_9SPHI
MDEKNYLSPVYCKKMKWGKQDIINFLKENHGKADILNLTELVKTENIATKDVYSICKNEKEQQVVFRAAWLLEEIFMNIEDSFTIILKDFLLHYPLQQNQSAQRHYSKIAMRISNVAYIKRYQLSAAQLKPLTEGSFDWLIFEDTPVAIKCNCIDILYNLSLVLANEKWIIDELLNILELNLLSESPALLSRTKRVLKKLKL